MKEHPILYSTAMVKAKLEGRKTVTRRIITPHNCVTDLPKKLLNWNTMRIDAGMGLTLFCHVDHTVRAVKCKWQPGDLMWAREAYFYCLDDSMLEGADRREIYRASIHEDFDEVMKERGWRWKPSIHMPKAAARIWDEVVSVRAERLQDITEEDAIAEGIEFEEFTWGPIAFPDGTIDHCVDGKKSRSFKDYSRPNHLLVGNPIGSYHSLWESINGPNSWDLNPLVWRVETKTLSTTGKP